MSENPTASQTNLKIKPLACTEQETLVLPSGDSGLVTSCTLVQDLRRHRASTRTQTAWMDAWKSWQKAPSGLTNNMSSQSSQEHTSSCRRNEKNKVSKMKLIHSASDICTLQCLAEHLRGAAVGVLDPSSPSRDGDIPQSAGSCSVEGPCGTGKTVERVVSSAKDNSCSIASYQRP